MYEHLENELPTFALVDDGLIGMNKAAFLIEKGRFYGMGYLPSGVNVHEIDDIKFRLTPYAENDYIRGMIYQYAERILIKKSI